MTASTEPRTENDALIEVARRSVAPTVLTQGTASGLLLVSRPDDVEIEQIDLGKYAERPRRKTGGVTLTDTPSFVAYVNRHRTPGTVLYADRTASRVVAVLNDHDAEPDADVTADEDGLAGWGDFRATLQLALTPEWQHWLAQNGKLLTQAQFAEHVEQGIEEIAEPPAAEMLELAQHFEARQKVDWKAVNVLQNGQRQFVYAETVEAKAGARGDVTIPREFVLGLAPYEGGGAFRITARLRYRLEDGALRIGYVLVRPHDLIRAAFAEVLTAVAQGTQLTPLQGARG